MKRIVFALVAGTTLVLPAAAQSPQMSQPTPAQQPPPRQEGQIPDRMSGSAATDQQPMAVKNLNESQVRDLQQALNKKGYKSGEVDGVWGPETRDALQNFQKAQGFTRESEELDQATIQALGLDTSPSFSRETTGMGGNQPSRDSQGRMNDPQASPAATGGSADHKDIGKPAH